ncbi:hypothetical protein F5Y17DRAFT_409760 [Xylariaceae sp. FL0594]|nr:hypothetical protein F5Y17DRAFT_409760 [Xylariaceae sp. FL0594]
MRSLPPNLHCRSSTRYGGAQLGDLNFVEGRVRIVNCTQIQHGQAGFLQVSHNMHNLLPGKRRYALKRHLKWIYVYEVSTYLGALPLSIPPMYMYKLNKCRCQIFSSGSRVSYYPGAWALITGMRDCVGRIWRCIHTGLGICNLRNRKPCGNQVYM